MREGTDAGRGERRRVARRVADVLRGSGSNISGVPPRNERPEPPSDRFAARRAVGERLQALAVRYTGVRIVPGRRAAAAVGAAALVAAVATVWWVLAARPHTVAVSDAGGSPRPVASSVVAATPPTSARSTRRAASRPAPTTNAALVVVDVAGKVRHPGIYRLPTGSRVDDAIAAAGGALPHVDLSSVNLAAVVRDGEQIAVGVPGAGPVAAGSSGAASGAATTGRSGPVDLNTASLGQLEALPGVGPVLAQHILDWRAAHGRFARVDQLREVSGIGPAKFATLQGLVGV